jgi:hypothetical protein
MKMWWCGGCADWLCASCQERKRAGETEKGALETRQMKGLEAWKLSDACQLIGVPFPEERLARTD